MRVGKIDVVAVLAITAAGRLLYYLSGVHFDASTLAPYMQFIDQELLTSRLLESLWFYHANPPLLNLFTGVVLKAFGEHSTFGFSLFYHTLGFVFACILFALVLSLSKSRRIAYTLCMRCGRPRWQR